MRDLVNDLECSLAPCDAPPRPTCLLISQSTPTLTGHGASMRAGQTLRALAALFEVTLLVITDLSRVTRSDMPEDLERLCSEVHFVKLKANQRPRRIRGLEPAELQWDQAALDAAAADWGGRSFGHVHVFRLRLMTVWRRLRSAGVRAGHVVLDLDDIESAASWRELRAHHRQLGVRTSLWQLLETLRLKRAERRAAQEVDMVLACSELDRERLSRRVGAGKVEVLPNAVQMPPEVLSPAPDEPSAAHQLLFVGSLFYPPNIEAAHWLLDELMPLLERRGVPAQLTIAGRQPAASLLRRQDAPPTARILADVPSMMPLYRAAHIVLCPVRTGGGTRIKIIEALAMGRPLVTTSIGAEGLDLRDGVNALFAESAAQFCDAIVKLSSQKELALRLAAAGRQHVVRRFSSEAFLGHLQRAHAPGRSADRSG